MSTEGRQGVRMEGVELSVQHGRWRRHIERVGALLLRAIPLALLLTLTARWMGQHHLVAPLGVTALGLLALGLTALGVSLGLSLRVGRSVGGLDVDYEGLRFSRDGFERKVAWGAVIRWQVQPRAEHYEVSVELEDGDCLYALLPYDAATERVLTIAHEAHGRRALVVPLCAEGSRAVVGDDGVDVDTGSGHRFVPFARVAEVDWDESSVILELRDGDSVTLSLMPPDTMRATGQGTVARAQARRDALHERIRQRLAEWSAREKSGHDEGGAVSLLDRNGRTLDAWCSAVRALVPEAGLSYRHLVLDQDTVANVLEDPHASVERRVAAAFALARRDDPEVRQRVRVVMEACASVPVRAAIDRAMHDALDEQTLDLVLEATAERAG